MDVVQSYHVLTFGKKNPTDDDIQRRLGWLGFDHEGWDNEEWSSVAPVDVLSSAGSNAFARSSAPSKRQSERDADVAAVKDEEKDKEPPKKKRKLFDSEGVASQLMVDFEHSGAALEARCRKCVTESTELIAAIDAHPDHKNDFDKAKTILQTRLAYLTKAVPERDGNGDWGSIDEIQQTWEKYLDDNETTRRAKETDPLYFLTKEVQCMPKLYQELANFTVDSDDQVKEVKVQAKEKLSGISTLCLRVVEQKARVAHMIKNTEKKKADAEAAIKKKEENDKKQAQALADAAAKVQGNKKVAPGPKSFEILNIGAGREIKKIKSNDFKHVEAHSGPCIVSFDPKPTWEAEADKELKEFTSKYINAPTASGRGAKQLAGKEVAQVDKVLKPFLSPCDEMIGQLLPAEQRYVRAPWEWCYTADCQYAGMEFAQCGSLKYQETGERQIMVTPFIDAMSWHQSTVPPGAETTLNDVSATLAAVSTF